MKHKETERVYNTLQMIKITHQYSSRERGKGIYCRNTCTLTQGNAGAGSHASTLIGCDEWVHVYRRRSTDPQIDCVSEQVWLEVSRGLVRL